MSSGYERESEALLLALLASHPEPVTGRELAAVNGYLAPVLQPLLTDGLVVGVARLERLEARYALTDAGQLAAGRLALAEVVAGARAVAPTRARVGAQLGAMFRRLGPLIEALNQDIPTSPDPSKSRHRHAP